MQTLQYNYINTPVRLFVEQLDAYVNETWPGTICTLDLKAALAELQEQAMRGTIYCSLDTHVQSSKATEFYLSS